jgi:hypothetical protein
MAEPKTRPTKESVKGFIEKIPDAQKRADCVEIIKLMQAAAGSKPVMWGPAIIGFGSQKLKYASGKELDWPVLAFSPRKQNLTLYGLVCKSNAELLAKLGKHSTSKACLYIKRLSDVDSGVLKKLINVSVKKKK